MKHVINVSFYIKKNETKEDGLSSGTIVLLTARLITIVGDAIAKGIITADPFADYEPERPERRQKYLTREKLDRLMSTH